MRKPTVPAVAASGPLPDNRLLVRMKYAVMDSEIVPGSGQEAAEIAVVHICLEGGPVRPPWHALVLDPETPMLSYEGELRVRRPHVSFIEKSGRQGRSV